MERGGGGAVKHGSVTQPVNLQSDTGWRFCLEVPFMVSRTGQQRNGSSQCGGVRSLSRWSVGFKYRDPGPPNPLQAVPVSAVAAVPTNVCSS